MAEQHRVRKYAADYMKEWQSDGGRLQTVRQPVHWFALLMEQKLQENDGRKGWVNLNLLWLCTKLQAEVGELAEKIALIHYDETGQQGKIGAIAEEYLMDLQTEAADVANYAMMIADRIQVQLSGGNDD